MEKIRKGDEVIVLTGRDKTRRGTVLQRVDADHVLVEGINVVKKHVKPSSKNPQGGILEVTKPIWVSKVGIVEPTTKKPTRVAYSFNKDGKKMRVFATNKKEIK